MLLIKNSLSGLSQFVLTAILTFVSIPLFIDHLGSELYGIFSIITLAGNLNVFANLGLNTALLKSLSEQGVCKESNYDIIVTIGLIVIILLLISVIAISFEKEILINLMNVPVKLFSNIKVLFELILFSNFILLIGQSLTTVLDSKGKVYLTNLFQFLYNLMYWGGLMLTVRLGYGISEIGYTILTAALIWFFTVVYHAKKTWGNLAVDGIRSNFFRITKKQLKLSSRVYSAGLLNFLFEPLTKILVSKLIGVTEVGYLDIAYRIKGQLWGLLNKIAYPLYPIIVQQKNTSKISTLIATFQVVILLTMLPIILILCFFTDNLIAIWLTDANHYVIESTRWISIINIIGAIAIPPYYYLLASGHSNKIVYLQIINVLTNSFVIFISYSFIGFTGVIYGNCLAVTCALMLSFYFQYKLLPPPQLRGYLASLRIKEKTKQFKFNKYFSI